MALTQRQKGQRIYAVHVRLTQYRMDEMEAFIGHSRAGMAFNNIYAELGKDAGVRPTLGAGPPDAFGAVNVPRVHHASERGQIFAAMKALTPDEQHDVIDNDDTRFFLNRPPELRYAEMPVPRPADLNGVINAAYSLATSRCIWGPVDVTMYRTYMAGRSLGDREELVRQIALMLYTVRNNTFHGGKEADDENAIRVLRHAYDLLKRIVDRHLPPADYA